MKETNGESIPLEEIEWRPEERVLFLKAKNGKVFRLENPVISHVEVSCGDEGTMTAVDITDLEFDNLEELE